MSTNGSRRWSPWRLGVPAISLGAGLLLAASAASAQGTDLRAGRRLQLPELIASQEQRAAQYAQRSKTLQAEVARISEADAVRSAPLADTRRQAAQHAAAAGFTPVTGPALEVTLDDAPRLRGEAVTSTARPDDLVVHEQDVQAVVNALWAGGAEAMSIMGKRVIATSAVRCVGNTLLLHGAVYSPPFVVTAVGDPVRMQEALDAAPGVVLFREYVDAYGLGYGERKVPDARLPAYEGPLPLTASRVPSGSAGSGSSVSSPSGAQQ